MDRKLIGSFFGKNDNDFSQKNEERTFSDIFQELVRLARDFAPQLESFVNACSFNTSIPKTLDNAIIGYLETREGHERRG